MIYIIYTETEILKIVKSPSMDKVLNLLLDYSDMKIGICICKTLTKTMLN